MRIHLMVPGSGGTFYCQNCLRDGLTLRALRALGHDVLAVPLYLPLFTGTPEAGGGAPVFFGGVNVFLQQHLGLFRKTPRWLDRFFDSTWVLRQAAQREGSTNAAELGPMTLSMLEGRSGRQRKEYRRLLDWLRTQPSPDVAHLSNALLLGLAKEIKETLGAAIVCSLQDEEPWVEAMHPPYPERCWAAMARAAQYVDCFVSPSAWYADRMAMRLGIARERIVVVPLGVDAAGVTPAPQPPEYPTIGFLSRLNEAQGLGLLADAFFRLRKDPALARLRLIATGGHTPADTPFLDDLRARAREEHCEDDLVFLENFQHGSRVEFMQSLSVLCVPTPGGEAFGMQLLEANAAGVPVVQPDAGAYPEVVAATGGGLIYDPARQGALEEALGGLLRDPERARAMGQRGRETILARFSIEHAAQHQAEVFAHTAKGTIK